MSTRAGSTRRPRPVKVGLPKRGALQTNKLLVRFGFGAAISLAAALIGLRFGPFVGGAFLAFPAILPASLTLIEEEEGKGKATEDVKGGVLGGVGLVSFGVAVTVFAARAGVPLALGVAMAAWTAVSAGLYWLVGRRPFFTEL